MEITGKMFRGKNYYDFVKMKKENNNDKNEDNFSTHVDHRVEIQIVLWYLNNNKYNNDMIKILQDEIDDKRNLRTFDAKYNIKKGRIVNKILNNNIVTKDEIDTIKEKYEDYYNRFQDTKYLKIIIKEFLNHIDHNYNNVKDLKYEMKSKPGCEMHDIYLDRLKITEDDESYSQCQAITLKNTQCKKSPLKNGKYCSVHNKE